MTEPSFLQSKNWARFQRAVGHPVFEATGIRFFKTSLPLGGSYLYCPHPDVTDSIEFLQRVVELVKQNRAWFVRVEPNVGSASIQYPVSSMKEIQYKIQNIQPVQPADTWQVPLGTEEAMLAAMHEKTRYNIRLAEKKGVTARFSSDPADAEVLVRLLEQTGERAGIRLHKPSYYQMMMEVMASSSRAQREIPSDKERDFSPQERDRNDSYEEPRLTVELAVTEYAGRPVAATLVAHYGDRVIYLHGGSDYAARSLMAPHALHWAVMRRAAAAGRTVYDLGGVVPDDVPNHPWAGITRFKQGFGGHAVHYPPAVDVIVRPMLYSLYTFARRLGRGLR